VLLAVRPSFDSCTEHSLSLTGVCDEPSRFHQTCRGGNGSVTDAGALVRAGCLSDWHPTLGLILFAWEENSQLHAWTMSPTGSLTYLAQSAEVASVTSVNSPGGMPGGFMSLSSNGNAKGTALLWASIPYGDANATITNGRFLCYDPDPDNYVTVNGNKQIPVLWDSERWNITYTHNKFNIPVVSGGKIFLPNYSGGVDVYGLA
jgi:hypothetical protein